MPLRNGRTARIGLVFVRQTSAPYVEPFFNQVMIGLEDGLSPVGGSLLVRRVEDTSDELSVYRQWREHQVVDGVVVKDLATEDPRPQVLDDLDLPYAMLTDVSQLDGHPAVYTDNAQTMLESVSYLIANGHRQIARVTGPAELLHTQIRTKAFLDGTASAYISTMVAVGNYSEDSGRRVTRELLTSVPRPSAIVYDNDLMAVGGLSAAQALGIAVPEALSLLAWDDSMACQLTNPPLSALSHNVHEIGTQLSYVLMRLLGSGVATLEPATQPVLVERGSTGRLDASAQQIEPAAATETG